MININIRRSDEDVGLCLTQFRFTPLKLPYFHHKMYHFCHQDTCVAFSKIIITPHKQSFPTHRNSHKITMPWGENIFLFGASSVSMVYSVHLCDQNHVLRHILLRVHTFHMNVISVLKKAWVTVSKRVFITCKISSIDVSSSKLLF